MTGEELETRDAGSEDDDPHSPLDAALVEDAGDTFDTCRQPLEAYCVTPDKCPVDVAAHRATLLSSLTEARCGYVTSSSCTTSDGETYVGVSWSYLSPGAMEFYFHADDGSLASVHVSTDANLYCDGEAFDIWYGRALTDCEPSREFDPARFRGCMGDCVEPVEGWSFADCVEPDPFPVTYCQALGCQGESYETWIDHYRVGCDGYEGSTMCHRVADSPDGPWSLDYTGFTSFTPLWGHRYRVLVQPVPVDHGIDAPDTLQSVVAVLDDEPVDPGTTFDFAVDPGRAALGLSLRIELDGEGGGRIVGGPEFRCDTEGVCDDLATLLTGTTPAAIRFRYGNDDLLPLTAVDLIPLESD